MNEDLKKSHSATSLGLQFFVAFSALLVLCLFNLFTITNHISLPHHEGMNTRMTLIEHQVADLEECVARLILACEQAEKEQK